MNRFARIAFAGVFAVLSSTAAEAQQPRQPAQVQPGQVQYHRGIGQSPWFSNPEVRQQFKLSDQQYKQLNNSYGESYGRYRQEVNNLGKDLTNEQRAQKMNELQQRFYKDFSTTSGTLFTDPQQRLRYDQLHLQYQGYNAFSDPMVQEKLNLTAEQRQKLDQYGQEWHKQMDGLGRTYPTDSAAATKQFNEMRKLSGERIHSVLSPEQEKVWMHLTGESYQFQPNAYFSTGVGAGTYGTK